MNVLGIMIMSLQTKNDLTDTRGLRLNRKQVAPTIKLEPLVFARQVQTQDQICVDVLG